MTDATGPHNKHDASPITVVWCISESVVPEGTRSSEAYQMRERESCSPLKALQPGNALARRIASLCISSFQRFWPHDAARLSV